MDATTSAIFNQMATTTGEIVNSLMPYAIYFFALFVAIIALLFIIFSVRLMISKF